MPGVGRWIGRGLSAAALALVLAPASYLAAEDDDPDVEGRVELTYRSVRQDGSPGKYDEDFDGLDTAVFLSDLELSWDSIDSNVLDHLRVDSSGLGDEPYERTSVRLGRKNVYELTLGHREQTYLYDLFGIVDDLDGSTWDSERRTSTVDLTLHAAEQVEVFVGFEQVRRDGTSLFLKTVNTDLFRLETPLDQEVRRYSVGARFALGRADVVFRHTLRRLDYRFDNTTAGDAGLSETDLVTLDAYDWRQTDRGDADLTTVTVGLPLGDRVHVALTAFGTLIGADETTSEVTLDASGTSFQGRCSISGVFCDDRNPCDTGVPGNVCVADAYDVSGGHSSAKIEADHLLLDADVSVKIVDPLDFHVQVRSLDHEIDSTQARDLDGNGTIDDTEGTVSDATPGSTTRLDRSLRSITGLFDYAPSTKVRLRAGYRTVDRELERSGFEYGTNDNRNTRFESKDDWTVVLGLLLKPVDWFRFDLDYEEGDVARALTAPSPFETDRLQVRVRMSPRPKMQLDLGLLDFENRNTDADFREAGSCDAPGADVDDGCWSSRAEGTTYSAAFRHEPRANLDYALRWARQAGSSVVRSRFDLDPFGLAENGDSLHDSSADAWSGRIGFAWASAWRGFVRFQVNRSEGERGISGPTLVSRLPIEQDYEDVELGATYTFPSRLYVGGRIRAFDYEDVDDRLSYDGDMFSIIAGLSF